MFRNTTITPLVALVGFLLVCVAQDLAGSPGALTLVQDGAPAAAIVIPDKPKQEERYAATQLRDYLEKISQAKLPILPESQHDRTTPAVFLGQTALADQNGVQPTAQTIGYDGYLVKCVGPVLIIRGARPRGVIFGVYQLLEQMGCRFYGPWESSEYLPQSKTVIVDIADRIVTPAIEYRSTASAPEKWSFLFRKRYSDWLLKIGLSDFGPMRDAQTYGFHWFMPEDKYFDQHPEWYSLHFGKRQKDSGDLCVSNPQMRQEFARNVIAWFKEHPDQDVAPINAHDGPARCECDNCRKLDDPAHPEDMLPRMLVFANDIAERVTGALPGKQVGLYAYYAGAQQLPDGAKPHPAIMPCFFPNNSFDEQRLIMKRWAQYVKSIYLYYWVALDPFEVVEIDWGSDDPALLRSLRESMQLKAQALYPELCGWSPSAAQMLYFMAHQAWDVDYNMAQAMEEYLRLTFGPAAPTMKRYYIQRRATSSSTVNESSAALNALLDEAQGQVDSTHPIGAAAVARARATLRVAADFAQCRALTTQYAQTRDEQLRLQAAATVTSAVNFLKNLKSQDVVWIDYLLEGPYRHYYYMQSIVTEPPRTHFDQLGPFTYYYDSMYEGPVTLADAVEHSNVSALIHCTVIGPAATGQLLYEFLAPPGGVFQSVEIRPTAHSLPGELSQFSVELSVDAGKTYTTLITDRTQAGQPKDISPLVAGCGSFLLKYVGTNSTDQPQVFVDCPKVSGATVAGNQPVAKIRYWQGWDQPDRYALPPLAASAVAREPVPLPAHVILFEGPTDLGYWSGYHQGLEYYPGKGFDDDSCLRLWENEGPGSSYISAIPAQPGDTYRLTFCIQVTAGAAQVLAEAKWRPLHLSKQLNFAPADSFEKVTLDIVVPAEPINPDQQSFTLYFTHQGTDAEFFIDNVELHRLSE